MPQKRRPAPAASCTDLSLEGLRSAVASRPLFARGTRLRPQVLTPNDFYTSLAHLIRDQLVHRMLCSAQSYAERGARTVAYLSAEYLLGPHLANHLLNLGILEETRQVLREYGLELDEILEQEEEPGLGNGGLGRLAACYLDSLATLEVPAIGYGIRYEFGIFDQAIHDGWQVEMTDKWLRLGNPWEIVRPELYFEVSLGGHTESFTDEKGRYRVRWIPDRQVRGFAYDTPISGYHVNTCNVLRLWKAEAVQSFDFASFNQGDYYGAVEEKVVSENVTKVLYPNDEPVQGKRLRLEQQYFLVSCSIQDMIRMHRLRGKALDTLHESYVAQLNDTHPSVAVAELMRLLVDEHGLDWDIAWKITTRTFAYTNHTLLPEALETWPLPLFRQVLPRHLEIVYEINRRFLDAVRASHPQDDALLARVSLIDEAGPKAIRMANLASVGSFAINGVAEMHTDLLRRTVLKDFYALTPQKFSNKTNGVTPRRWLALGNPSLARLISSRIGDGWICNFEHEIQKLEGCSDDPALLREWSNVKLENKRSLARVIQERCGISVDSSSLFDVQVKRIHEYKRQHLNVLHIVTLYNRIKWDRGYDVLPRTFVLAGKAAPGYAMAKLVIKLIHSVAEVINSDPDVEGRLRVVFLPDFNVKSSLRVYPAADLSEQISTAGKEASGTGNMKFAMNGALTIGTLDGANVEIRDAVGPESFFLFGLTAEEVAQRKSQGYDPRAEYEREPELKAAIDRLLSGDFSRGDRLLFRPLVDSLLYHDEYMLLADYASYVECQERVSAAYRDPVSWSKKSILNVARVGKFSSDRAVREYCDDIWNVGSVPVDVS